MHFTQFGHLTTTIALALAAAGVSRDRDASAARVAAIHLNPTQVTGGAPVRAVVELDAPAPPSGSLVSVSVNQRGATVPRTVTVAAGATRAGFVITTDLVSQATTIVIAVRDTQAGVTIAPGPALVKPGIATATLTLQPLRAESLTLASDTVVGGQKMTATVRLSATAPPAGVTVALRSTTAVARTPGSVFVPGGQDQAQFDIATQPVSEKTIATLSTRDLTLGVPAPPPPGPQLVSGGTGALAGAASAQLTVVPGQLLQDFTLRPTTTQGGQNIIGSLRLMPGAPTPVVVSLTTDHPEILAVPATVTLTQSQVAQPFTMTTSAVQGTVVVQVTVQTSVTKEKRTATVSVVP